jgi:hypothetical protein
VNIVPGVPAALAGIFLFLVPGLVALGLLAQKDREALELDEALYLLVATSVLASAWVGLVLAELGRFSLVTAGAILAAVSLVAALLARRRLSWPLRRPAGWRRVLPALAVLALAFSLQARPSQYIVGGRDPGAYVAAMGLIARTGGIVYEDPGVLSIPEPDRELFFRHPQGPPFSWSRFMGFDLERPESGRVVPQFFHLFPAFGAYLFQAMGVKGALATPPLFGILGTLGVFFALRRMLGQAPALLAALLLGSNVVQVWFARYPVSETCSQFLAFLGILAFLHWEERASAPCGVLAGAALGLSLLVRIDSLLIVVPLGLYLLIRRARGDLPWRQALPLVAPFVLLAVHGAVHALLFSRKYVADIATRRYWSHPPAAWIAALALALLCLLLAHRLGPRLARLLSAHGERWRTALVLSIVALALYAYFVRPALSAWAGADGNDAERALRDPGWLHALGFRRLAAHDAQSFVRLGWFVSPAALALGVLGALAVIRDWRRNYLFPVLVAATFAGFYFYKIRVYNDYFFALRRFVPVVLPFLLGLAAFFLCRIARRGGARRVAAGVLAVGLLASYADDTRAIARFTDWNKSVDFVRDVARRFGPGDVVIFEQPRSIHLLSLPLWAAHGVNILELARFNPDPDRLRHLLEAWRGRYRNIYFVHTYRTDLCGVFLQRVEDYSFGTYEWERTYRTPPRQPEFRALHFTVSRVVPPEELRVPSLPEVDVGGSDDFQVSGFFGKEGGGDRTYRWTGPCASVYLPGVRAGARLVLTASVGKRPPDLPALVRATLSGVPLGSFAVGPLWAEHAVRLPERIPPGPPVLRLDVTAWRPANVVPGSSDTRELGVMVDRIRVQAVPPSRVNIGPPPGTR